MTSRETCSAGAVYKTEKWKWRDDGAICFSLSYARYLPRNFSKGTHLLLLALRIME